MGVRGDEDHDRKNDPATASIAGGRPSANPRRPGWNAEGYRIQEDPRGTTPRRSDGRRKDRTESDREKGPTIMIPPSERYLGKYHEYEVMTGPAGKWPTAGLAIEVEKKLGEGTFGRVLRCRYRGLPRNKDTGKVIDMQFRREKLRRPRVFTENLQRGRRFAVKVIRASRRLTEDAQVERDICLKARERGRLVQSFNRELGKLQVGKRGENDLDRICKLYDQFFTTCQNGQQHFCMVFEICGGSVWSLIEANQERGFVLGDLQPMARDCLSALRFFEGIGLAHTDLKPENILLCARKKRDATPPRRDFRCFDHKGYERVRGIGGSSSDYDLFRQGGRKPSFDAPSRYEGYPPFLRGAHVRCKIIDFGGANFRNQWNTGCLSTRQYRAPEVFLEVTANTAHPWDKPLSNKLDVFSMGCIFYEMLTGNVLLDGSEDDYHYRDIEHTCGPFPPRMTALAREEILEQYFVPIPESVQVAKNRRPLKRSGWRTEGSEKAEFTPATGRQACIGAGAGDEEEDDETDSSGLSSDSEEQPPGGQTRDRVGDGIKRKGAEGEGEENANANGSPLAPARVADSTVAREVQIDAAVEQPPSSPRRTTVVNLNTAVLGTPTGRTGLAPGVDSATATPTSVGATTAFLEDFSPEEVAALESEVTELERKIHDLRRHREISRHTLQGGKGLFYAAPSPGRPFGSLHFRVPAEREQLVPDESVDECVEQREAWIRKQRRNDELLEPLRKKYPPNWVCKKRSPTSSSSSSTWREELEDDAAKLPRPSRLKRRIERKTELLQKLEKAKERNWDRATPRGFGFWWNRADGDAAGKKNPAIEDGVVGTAPPEALGTEPDAPGASAQSEDNAARSRVTSDAPGPVGPGIRTD
eukprot:g6641.t1